MAQVTIVSNRLPVSVKKIDGKLEFYPSDGGVARGLSSYIQDRHHLWIGWPGIASEDLEGDDKNFIAGELKKYHCYPVFLTRDQLDEYYNGYSNKILWPLFHNLPTKLDNHERYFKTYRAVNKLFAEVILSRAQTGSNVWVHDYLLLLLPEMLRAERPKANIGFFLHIPWPSQEVFTELPEAKKLLRGVLGGDLVGLHTIDYVNNFLETCAEFYGAKIAENKIILPNRSVKVTDFPIGIDYDKFAQSSETILVKNLAKKYREKYKGLKVILTIDRLEPTKGLVERLEAYRQFLKTNPRFHGRVVMAMLAVPSRTEIEDYQKLKAKVERLVGKINESFGTVSWQPVDYMYKSIPFEEVAALYSVADVAFIAPIIDGMNLVAKEYVASKSKKAGVLILSETAGAAQQLKEALLVNPLQRSSLVEALNRAFEMSERDLKKHMASMQQSVAANTIYNWADNFLVALRQPTLAQPFTKLLKNKPQKEVLRAYRASSKRLLLFDYDGVLSPFFSVPSKATPSTQLLVLLRKLAEVPDNDIILISGRPKADLEAWFGSLPINLVAEHGAFTRKADSPNWHKTFSSKTPWQSKIMSILEFYAAKTPGAFVEAKESTLVWHYRMASAYYTQKHLVILKRLLKPLARKYGLEVCTGSMVLEVRPQGVHKGLASASWLKAYHDFVLAIGDDNTDEDMFTYLPDRAYTIKVGHGPTVAKYRLQSVNAVLDLLEKLAK
ncbi:MAG TPA: bifunctional alpha,alpha-trehalose-phosphate synthase (UDP-forming)/trehalose-phosphatase [Candidatus Saccharimonadales bacterium]|nr:bifunctional alpha,alpha-trehalose-phosphate synthase (UDP-forming)/trehalose-phosphatase [Candidatus Saccharimonadales bacterium]